jgi:hypothetical protein
LQFSLVDCDIDASQIESVIEIHDCPIVDIRNNRFSSKDAASNLLLVAKTENMMANISNNPGLNEPEIWQDNGKTVSIRTR